MDVQMDGAEPTAGAMRRAAPVAAGVLGLAFVVAVVGGYQQGWTWTGFSHSTTVWSWLQLLLVPCILTALPLWYRTRGDQAAWWTSAAVLAAAGGAFVALAYALHWTWTGFPGKTLWDWLTLLVLPLVLVTLPLWLGRRRTLHPAWRAAGAAALVLFALTVAGGYGLDWGWTGFHGNTLRDWLHLLLVPFVLPLGFTWLSVRLKEIEQAAGAEPAKVGG
jgi:heme/copper-type cytochrome/quinol oxidase subunit 4